MSWFWVLDWSLPMGRARFCVRLCPGTAYRVRDSMHHECEHALNHVAGMVNPTTHLRLLRYLADSIQHAQV